MTPRQPDGTDAAAAILPCFPAAWVRCQDRGHWLARTSLLRCVVNAALVFGATVPAHAAVTFTFAQVGADVVITAAGTLDTGALTFLGNVIGPGISITPNDSAIGVALGTPDVYIATLQGPASFGPGGVTSTCCLTGGDIGFDVGGGTVMVPGGYVSGSGLGTTATFQNHTYPSLGVTPGSYSWDVVGRGGAFADKITMEIPRISTAVPEPASALLLGIGLLGLATMHRRGA